jgi:hypothetical protein
MNVLPVDIWAGEDRTLTLAARDSANAPVNLTNKTVTFRVARPLSDVAVFEKTGSTISASAGTFSVAIADSDTQNMSGDYRYTAYTTDGSGNIAVVCSGRFRVRQSIGAVA